MRAAFPDNENEYLIALTVGLTFSKYLRGPGLQKFSYYSEINGIERMSCRGDKIIPIWDVLIPEIQP